MDLAAAAPGFAHGAVEDLPPHEGPVSVGPEMLGEGDPVLEAGAVPKAVEVSVDAGGGGPEPGEDGRPGRAAQGHGAVGSLEEHALAGQLVDVRRGSVGVPAQTPNPVIDVVQGDEEHVVSLSPQRRQTPQVAAQGGSRGRGALRGCVAPSTAVPAQPRGRHLAAEPGKAHRRAKRRVPQELPTIHTPLLTCNVGTDRPSIVLRAGRNYDQLSRRGETRRLPLHVLQLI